MVILQEAELVSIKTILFCFAAEGLAHLMNELFSGVVYAGIDTDKYRYPIGR